MIRYFIRQGVPIDPIDRWGHSPLDDADRHGFAEAAALLRAAGGRPGGEVSVAPDTPVVSAA